MARPAIKYRSAGKSAYVAFKKECPHVKITYTQYKKIVYTFNEQLGNHVLETGEFVKLPYGFGKISINKKKQTKYYEKDGKTYCVLGIDWKKTNELGEKIYHLNAHTDGYRYRWLWVPDGRVYQIQIWTFSPSRHFSRTLAKYLKKPNSPYKDIYGEYIKRK